MITKARCASILSHEPCTLFSNAHFWVLIDMFVMYNLPMQQGSQKIQYSMKIFHFFFNLFIQIHDETRSTFRINTAV